MDFNKYNVTKKEILKTVKSDILAGAKQGGQKQRVKLLALGFLRGMPYAAIERSTNEDNLPDEPKKAFYKLLASSISEYVCSVLKCEDQTDIIYAWFNERVEIKEKIIEEPYKLYVITRKDLADGPQAVQLCHAAIQFIFDHYEQAQHWHKTSDFLCLLSVDNEDQLCDLIQRAVFQGIKYSAFQEPNYENAITAIALEPGAKSKEFCKDLDLALNKDNFLDKIKSWF